MRKKQKKPVPKSLQDYLTRKIQLECEYTEFGVMSYIVPTENGVKQTEAEDKAQSKSRNKRRYPDEK